MFCWVVERKLWQGILGVVALAAVTWGVVAFGGDTPLGRFALRWAQRAQVPVEHRAGEQTGALGADVAGADAVGGGVVGADAAETDAAAADAVGMDAVRTDPVRAGALDREVSFGDDGAVPAWAEAGPGEPVAVDLWALVPEGEGQDDGNTGLTAPASGFPGSHSLSSESLYEAFRLERDRLHARQVEAIERAFADPEVAEERRWESHMLMLEMLAAREREVELEYMLRAGGYPDAVVAVRGDYANVVVEGVLDEQGASRIGELVVRVAGVAPERIAIVDGYSGP